MPQVQAKFMQVRAAYFPEQERDGEPVGQSFVTWLPPGRWTLVCEETIEVREGRESQVAPAMRLVNAAGKVRYVSLACFGLLALVPPPRKPKPVIVRLID